MKSSGLKGLALIVFLTAFAALYQNCSAGFKADSSSGSGLLESSGAPSSPGSENSGGTPLPSPGPSPSPSPSTNPSRTFFYFGRAGGIDILQLDHSNGQITHLGNAPFDGESAGWMSYDSKSSQIFVPDAGNTKHLQVFAYNASTGILTPKKTFNNFTSAVVHLTLLPSDTEFRMFGASYGNGVLGYFKSDSALTTGTLLQEVGFASGAKTHSSAYDSKRNLLYVANLGLNQISVFQVGPTGLTAVTEISVISPRTVVYDPVYDKIFVSTEASTGSSYIHIFSIQASGNSYTFTNSGSQAMPLSGSDLKVNHRYRYVMAAAREAGKESIWGLPITESGVTDSSRKTFSIPLTQKMPRALEITADGLFIFSASQVADNIVGYKLNFDSSLNYVSSTKIFSQKIGTEGYLCSLSIP